MLHLTKIYFQYHHKVPLLKYKDTNLDTELLPFSQKRRAVANVRLLDSVR